MENETVLINSMRPKKLDDILGQKEIIDSIKKQFESKKIPHFFMLIGDSGTGKTTIARIIALMLQNADPTDKLSKYDIQEINAADKNGVDDIRQLIELSKFKPINPSISKVLILDECHQLTTSAQNALLKITEDAYSHLYFIFSTSNSTKIIEALKRRAYIIRTKGLCDDDIEELLERACDKYNTDKEIVPLKEALIEHGINSPGFILQAVEKYFNGHEVSECIMLGNSTNIDTRKLCLLISKGDWKSSAILLKTSKKEDVVMLRMCITGYLKVIMFSCTGEKAVLYAKAIKLFGDNFDELSIFLANVCLVCETIRKELLRKN
jgi:DNA polymerase III delta prime subunit